VFLPLWVGVVVYDAFLGLGKASGQEEEDAGRGLVVGAMLSGLRADLCPFAVAAGVTVGVCGLVEDAERVAEGKGGGGDGEGADETSAGQRGTSAVSR
jgi:hypothetical protein